MKRIIVHDCNSVSEYILDDKKQIAEIKYLSDNRTKYYKYDESNPAYDSIINLFYEDDMIFYITENKNRSINEYRQNKDNIYFYSNN